MGGGAEVGEGGVVIVGGEGGKWNRVGRGREGGVGNGEGRADMGCHGEDVVGVLWDRDEGNNNGGALCMEIWDAGRDAGYAVVRQKSMVFTLLFEFL